MDWGAREEEGKVKSKLPGSPWRTSGPSPSAARETMDWREREELPCPPIQPQEPPTPSPPCGRTQAAQPGCLRPSCGQKPPLCSARPIIPRRGGIAKSSPRQVLSAAREEACEAPSPSSARRAQCGASPPPPVPMRSAAPPARQPMSSPRVWACPLPSVAAQRHAPPPPSDPRSEASPPYTRRGASTEAGGYEAERPFDEVPISLSPVGQAAVRAAFPLDSAPPDSPPSPAASPRSTKCVAAILLPIPTRQTAIHRRSAGDPTT